jgi:hypothetical protein
VAKTICKAKKLGEVKRRGKASLEWRDEDGTPHYYCYGYNDGSTEELIPVCRECIDNVIYAQDDLEQSILQEVEQ